MQIQDYTLSLNKIVLFCERARDGFVIVEINNLRKKKKLLQDLKNKFNVKECSWSQIEQHNVFFETEKKEIVIVDETCFLNEKYDIDDFATNLNYNRDWLSKLNKVIVFLMPSWKVNKMITYSNSFWSFVSLHIIFDEKSNCVLTPHYVNDGFHSFYNKEAIKRKKHLYKDLYGTSMSNWIIKEISSNSKINLYYDQDPEDFLNAVFNNFEKHPGYRGEKLIRDIMQLADCFSYEKKYKKAKQCYHFLIKHVDFFNENLLNLKSEIYFSLAYVCYENKEYFESLQLLDLLKQFSEKNTSLFSKYDIAIILNNIGVNLYMLDKSNVHIPLEAIYESIDAINFEDETLLLGDVLFNASLFAYVTGDNDKSLYYIRYAISVFEQYSNRTYKIFVARYKILETFILLSQGDFQRALNNMEQSIHYLRDELYEDHLYILEAHYVYALLFYNLDELERAQKCINKAVNIIKKIKCTNNLKVHIWSLYGFILYENGNYDESENYLNLAYRRGKNDLSEDTIAHIHEIIKPS